MIIRCIGPKSPRVQPERYKNINVWAGPTGQASIKVYEHEDGSWFGATYWDGGAASYSIPKQKEPEPAR